MKLGDIQSFLAKMRNAEAVRAVSDNMFLYTREEQAELDYLIGILIPSCLVETAFPHAYMNYLMDSMHLHLQQEATTVVSIVNGLKVNQAEIIFYSPEGKHPSREKMDDIVLKVMYELRSRTR